MYNVNLGTIYTFVLAVRLHHPVARVIKNTGITHFKIGRVNESVINGKSAL